MSITMPKHTDDLQEWIATTAIDGQDLERRLAW